MELNMTTLENLIIEKYSDQNATLVNANALDDDSPRHWAEAYHDIYDSENCLVNKRINAEHRNKIKI